MVLNEKWYTNEKWSKHEKWSKIQNGQKIRSGLKMKSGIKMKVDKKKQWSKDCSNKIEVKISLKLSNYFSFRKHKFLTNLPTFFFQNAF